MIMKKIYNQENNVSEKENSNIININKNINDNKFCSLFRCEKIVILDTYVDT